MADWWDARRTENARKQSKEALYTISNAPLWSMEDTLGIV
jgi:hypothetical protein